MDIIIDPRESIIKDRLKNVKNILLVSGFKGGIGKSLISTTLALAFSDRGYKTGLLDLDLTSATDHIILGVNNLYPFEDKGLIPAEFEKIKFMSFHFFTMNMPLALRGKSISCAIKELLCVTIWGELDFLIVDMPPGFSDTTFEVLRLFERFILLAVSTPSPLSKEILHRMIKVYDPNKTKIIFLENMVKEEGKRYSIRYDAMIDYAVGNVEKLKKTEFYKDITKIIPEIEKECL